MLCAALVGPPANAEDALVPLVPATCFSWSANCLGARRQDADAAP